MSSRRPRLGVRWMMAAVAMVALAIVSIPPAYRLLWLYNHPASVKTFNASILCRPAPGQPPQARPGQPTYPVGQPFRMQVTSNGTPASWLPAGLTFRVDVVVKVTDPKDFDKIYETQRRGRDVVSGPEMPGQAAVVDLFELKTPGQAGSYAVRYELWASDRFGRTNMGASATTYFDAQ